MKSRDLQPFKEPPPPEREACRACRTFAPDCLVPVGDGAVPMCWLCAHHVVEHGTELEHACSAECECLPHEIYPHRTPPVADVTPPPEPKVQLSPREKDRERILRQPVDKLEAWAREAHKQMSNAQLEAVKKRLN